MHAAVSLPLAHLSQAILAIHVAHGISLLDLGIFAAAFRMGVAEAAVRYYELMKALPKEEHIQKLAAAFGVRPECLPLYDFSAGSILANALFQLGETYGLAPQKDARFAALIPGNAFMERFLKDWASQYELLKQGRSSSARNVKKLLLGRSRPSASRSTAVIRRCRRSVNTGSTGKWLANRHYADKHFPVLGNLGKIRFLLALWRNRNIAE